MAKAVVPSLDAVPEALRSEYEKQADGTFALKLEGAPAGFVAAKDLAEVNSKLAEFRDNNRTLNAAKTELEQKLAALKDIDPVEYKATKDKLAALEKKAPESEVALKALQTQIETLGKQIADSNKAASDAAEKLARKELESTLTTHALKAGLQEQAIPDFLARGAQVWIIEDGKPVAKRGGAPLFSKKNGANPLTPEEWVGDMVTEAPHLFKASSGGGHPHAGANGNGSAGNGQVRTIPEGQPLTGQDVADIAAGKAIRAESVA